MTRLARGRQSVSFKVQLTLIVCLACGAASSQEPLLLSADPVTASFADSSLPDTISRTRPVYVNTAARPGADSNVGDTLLMNLFPDVQTTVILEALVERGDQVYSWIGRIKGEPYSSVTISVLKDVTQANIHSTTFGEYQIRYIEGEVHEVRQIDPAAFPPCSMGTEHAVAPSHSKLPPRRARMNAKTATYIVDIIVVYTAAAQTAVGGVAPMEALINLAIDESNDAYLFSEVDMELRLVHQQAVTYTETTFNNALTNLTTNGDGIMDEVHTLRETYGADMVSLLIDEPSSCGLAWLMTSLAGDFSANAFSVEHHGCATGYYSFAHELGHNMGSTHDIANAGGQGLFPYSYGWRWNSNIYRSIMAYAPGTRVQRFSNPNVLYLGAPTGSAGVADNAASLNAAAATVAGWRDAVGTISVSPGAGANFSGEAGGPFSPATFSYTLTNLSGSESADWTASASEAWVSLSSTSGTLPASGNVVVDVSMSVAANALAGGSHPATVTFTEVDESLDSVRNVTLTVGGPPPNARYWFAMDSDPGWTTQGAWAFGVPLGLGSANHDPTSGRTGQNVYGYNLSGDYSDNLAEQYLTTTAIDCAELENVGLNFYRWLGIEQSIFDHAKVQVSNNGSSWTDVWTHSGGNIGDTVWLEQDFDISAIADGQSTVFVRWVMGTTDSSITFPGWNIDDVALTGDLAVALTDLWVDFAYTGIEWGTEGKPYSLLGTAVDALSGPYTIYLKGDASPPTSAETLVISTPCRLETIGGAVRIGA
ncbi:MAG: M12 family metallo-peptidase [Candidatus Hydrogenedentes bacterium]|nr:M12 family metallo-peptidase [Candidatus Hydrogenedentota bacterium]